MAAAISALLTLSSVSNTSAASIQIDPASAERLMKIQTRETSENIVAGIRDLRKHMAGEELPPGRLDEIMIALDKMATGFDTAAAQATKAADRAGFQADAAAVRAVIVALGGTVEVSEVPAAPLTGGAKWTKKACAFCRKGELDHVTVYRATGTKTYCMVKEFDAPDGSGKATFADLKRVTDASGRVIDLVFVPKTANTTSAPQAPAPQVDPQQRPAGSRVPSGPPPITRKPGPIVP